MQSMDLYPSGKIAGKGSTEAINAVHGYISKWKDCERGSTEAINAVDGDISKWKDCWKGIDGSHKCSRWR